MELFICIGFQGVHLIWSCLYVQVVVHIFHRLDNLKKVVLICGIQNLICQIIYFIECASQGYNAS